MGESGSEAVANEELRLVAAAQRGDVESFNALVRLYEGRVYNLCYRLLGDADSAADAAQDTFLSAYRHLHAFRGGSFRSWVLRIATNVCYDALRARQRRPVVSLDASGETAAEESPSLQIADTRSRRMSLRCAANWRAPLKPGWRNCRSISAWLLCCATCKG